MSKGRLIVISGASGVGKSSVLEEVLSRRKDLLFSVSATTRSPRAGERDGVNYFYVTRDRFEQMIAGGEFLEHDEHNGHLYGTLKSQINEKLEQGHVVLDVEPNGAFAIREIWPDAILVFLVPPDMAELERRLRNRKNTPAEEIPLRLERARWEMTQKDRYDYVVLNDVVARCVGEILHIIAEKAD